MEAPSPGDPCPELSLGSAVWAMARAAWIDSPIGVNAAINVEMP
jgi:hypothetical protein